MSVISTYRELSDEVVTARFATLMIRPLDDSPPGRFAHMQ